MATVSSGQSGSQHYFRLGLPPEQPRYVGAEQLAGRALAVVEGSGHSYSKNWRPAPTLSIHQEPPMSLSKNRTVSPFENLAAARCPLITTS